MSSQISIVSSGNRERTVSAQFAPPAIILKIFHSIAGFFRLLIASLQESRRRQASRIVEEYRQLPPTDYG